MRHRLAELSELASKWRMCYSNHGSPVQSIFNSFAILLYSCCLFLSACKCFSHYIKHFPCDLSFLQPDNNHLRQIIINEVQRGSVICPKSLSNNGWSFDSNLNVSNCQARFHFQWAFTAVSSRCFFSTFEALCISLVINIFYNQLKLSDYKQLDNMNYPLCLQL